jgi:hypothetical protein
MGVLRFGDVRPVGAPKRQSGSGSGTGESLPNRDRGQGAGKMREIGDGDGVSLPVGDVPVAISSQHAHHREGGKGGRAAIVTSGGAPAAVDCEMQRRYVVRTCL